MLKNIVKITCVFLLLVGIPTMVAAQRYPSKPIRILVPSGAATPGDMITRIIGMKLSPIFEQPVMIENRRVPTDAVEALMGSSPDGYTLLVGTINTPASKSDSRLTLGTSTAISLISMPLEVGNPAVKFGFYAPLGISEEIKKRIADEVERAVAQPETQKFLASLNAAAVAKAAAETGRLEAAAKAAEADSADRLRTSESLSADARAKSRDIFFSAFQLFQTGEFGAAAQMFNQGLKIDPANVPANFYLGETYTRLKRTAEARQQYDLVVRLGKGTKEAALAESRLASN